MRLYIFIISCLVLAVGILGYFNYEQSEELNEWHQLREAVLDSDVDSLDLKVYKTYKMNLAWTDTTWYHETCVVRSFSVGGFSGCVWSRFNWEEARWN